jgi:benzoyl-CoA reductase/2-hydroxyglutaryl-CoA dehydratase subunit BcrC/BadD/HgdB
MTGGRIGFTTSVPVEIILAAGKTPVDLNNVFIGDASAQYMVEQAEAAGYPRNTCGWIKGLYTAARSQELEALIAVVQGDCSNAEALMETLQLEGLAVIPFAYPFDRDRAFLARQLDRLAAYFSVGAKSVLEARARLDGIRAKCAELDRLTWAENVVSGKENHLFLVSASDFNGDPARFEAELDAFLDGAARRKPFKERVRLAYIGVPPIFTDLYDVLEDMGARVVFNEVQRQFAMPDAPPDLVDQYLAYTYPYGAFVRLEDMGRHLAARKADGVIHYTQTFCYRQIEDMVFRRRLPYPLLTLEGDKPGRVDARTRMRLEAFVGMLG